MIITVLNWRLFANLSFELDLAKNGLILFGPNGSGKTSILMAICTYFTGFGFGNYKIADQIQTNTEFLNIQSDTNSNWYLSMQINPISGKIEKKYSKPSLIKANINLCPIIFTYHPGMNNWFELERAKKLKILDEIITNIFGIKYKKLLTELNSTLKSKQALLKKYNKNQVFKIQQSDSAMLTLFNAKIITLSEAIWNARELYWGFIINNFPRFQENVETKINNFKLRVYKTNLEGNRSPLLQKNLETNLKIEKLNKLFPKEVIAQSCLFTATRDDFAIEINNENAPGYLSRGEMRFLILFFIKMGINMAKSCGNIAIWFFLDDVLNELDEKRVGMIFRVILKEVDFWVITTTIKTPFDEGEEIQFIGTDSRNRTHTEGFGNLSSTTKLYL